MLLRDRIVTKIINAIDNTKSSLCFYCTLNDTNLHWCRNSSTQFWIQVHSFIKRFFYEDFPNEISAIQISVGYHYLNQPKVRSNILTTIHSYALWTLWRARLKMHFYKELWSLQTTLGTHLNAMYYKLKSSDKAFETFFKEWNIAAYSNVHHTDRLNFSWK